MVHDTANKETIMRQVVAYKRLKIKKNYKTVVAVAYDSFYYRAMTGKILVFWIGGRLREVVAYERWSHMESRL